MKNPAYPQSTTVISNGKSKEINFTVRAKDAATAKVVINKVISWLQLTAKL